MSDKKKREDQDPMEAPESAAGTPDTEGPAPDAAPEPEKPAGPTPEELLAQEKDKYLRLLAEYDNYRKRSQKEREGLYTTVRSDTVAAFLPIYDDLERALKHGCQDEAFLKGVELTMTELNKILDRLGVKPIEAVGQKFDANLHNAVMHVEDDTAGEGVVVEEFQKGFTLGGKVVRFSMVKVAN